MEIFAISDKKKKNWNTFCLQEYKKSAPTKEMYENILEQALDEILEDVCKTCPRVCGQMTKKWMEYRK